MTKEELTEIEDGCVRGEPEAWYRMGRLHMKGDASVGYGANNVKEAEKFYRLAAEKGHPKAMAGLAKLLEQAKAGDEAMEWWRKAAGAGVAGAQYTVARDIARKNGGQHTPESLELLEKAADQHIGKAVVDLAAAYDNGAGVPRDRDRAEAILREGLKSRLTDYSDVWAYRFGRNLYDRRMWYIAAIILLLGGLVALFIWHWLAGILGILAVLVWIVGFFYSLYKRAIPQDEG